MLVSESFVRLGEAQRAERMCRCGMYLEFTDYEDGTKRLTSANFCRERMCVMCQWRRSLKHFVELSRVMNEVEENYDFVPIFLTLTVKNCDAPSLYDTITQVLKGWFELQRSRRFEGVGVAGWFRALEVTYNKEANTFHPHIHAVLYMPKGYAKSSPKYIEHSEWIKLWRQAARLDYDPSVDVRKIYKTKAKEVSELAKYAVKDSEFVDKDPTIRDFLVGALFKGLFKRRLTAYGGLLKQIAKAPEDEKTEDLIHVEDEGQKVRGDVVMAVRTYGFDIGFRRYVEVAS